MGVSGGFAAMGVMSAGNSIAQGKSQKAQDDFTASQYDSNARLATEQGAEAKAAGDINAGQAAEEGRQQVAKQRVAAAATGADVNSGSALSLQADTNWQAKQNQITIKNNAWRTAWGYNTQAIDYGTQAQFSRMAGNNAMNNSYLTGGMQAIGYGVQAGSAYNKYNGKSGDSPWGSGSTLSNSQESGYWNSQWGG